MLADSGASRSCVSRLALDEGRIKNYVSRTVNILVNMADTAPVVVKQAVDFKIVSLEGVLIPVTALVLPRLAGCDVLIGMDVLGAARRTTFDWYGKRILLETESGIRSFRLRSQRENKRQIRVMSDITLKQGINQVSQEMLGVYLSNAIINGVSCEDWIVPQQYFELGSENGPCWIGVHHTSSLHTVTQRRICGEYARNKGF